MQQGAGAGPEDIALLRTGEADDVGDIAEQLLRHDDPRDLGLEGEDIGGFTNRRYFIRRLPL
jgi:hypothetical protein